MPKAKGKKGKKGKGSKKKDIDWAADINYNKNRSMVYIEHSTECPIFQIKAEQVQIFLQERIPERIFQLVRNTNGKVTPREGAFEINFAQTARTSTHNMWSGVDKGPPRRDKFPADLEILVPQVRTILKKVYVDLTEKAQEDEEDGDDGGDYGIPIIDLTNDVPGEDTV